MGAYGAVTGEEGTIQTQGQLPNANGRMQGVGQPQQVHVDPAHPANVASQTASNADAGTNMVTAAYPAETPAERSSRDSSRVNAGRTPSGFGSCLAKSDNERSNAGWGTVLTPSDRRTDQEMRSELADSMFTEPKEDDERQTRICLFCE
jgi:hypothetical protein